jgi:recombination protein RecA
MSTSTVEAAKARADVFDAFLAKTKREDPGALFRLNDEDVLDVDVIPTGIFSLDVALGVGGLPRGRIVEIYGPESGGKSALSMQVCAMAQKAGGYVGYLDVENAFDPMWAESAFGIDPDRCAFGQPDNGNKVFNLIRDMCVSGAFDVIVVDSVAAMRTEAQAEADLGDENRIGQHAKMMSDGLKWLTPIVAQTRSVVIFVNQIRMDPGAYGNPETTTGGRALRFYASVRIEVRSAASKRIIGPDKDPIGQLCSAKVVKNKVAPPHRRAEWDLYYATGISTEGALLDAAVKTGVVEKNSATYTEVATGERIAVGKDKAKAQILADPELEARLTEALYSALNANRISASPTEDRASTDDFDPDAVTGDDDPADEPVDGERSDELVPA